MPNTNKPFDEYTLAAFLAGTLPEEERAAVIAYLAAHEEARELLVMSAQALEASRQPDDVEATLPSAPDVVAASRPAARPDRPAQHPTARPRAQRWSMARYTSLALLVFCVGLVLRLTLGPPTDALRSEGPSNVLELAVRPSLAQMAFQWNTIDEAYQYHLVIWDPAEARVVAEHTTAATHLDDEDAFVQSLNQQLEAGHAYDLRVDAYDAQNRLIQSSDLVQFTLRP